VSGAIGPYTRAAVYVSIGDCRLFFDVEGAKLVPDGPEMRERPTLILLHGGPGFDHSTFKPAFSRLADAAQVIYLDHRGNGRSDRGHRDAWTLARWADDLPLFCEALGIEKPVVLGHSFGGMVAMAYAARHPDHPGKLVLSSTAARMRLDRVLDTFERLGGPEVREAARRYWEAPSAETLPDYARLCFPLYNRTPRDPDANARTCWNFEVMFHFGGDEDRRMDLLAGLAGVRCPTLVLGGEDDPICPIADQADIAAALPPERARFERFAGCGHGVFRDAPERAFAVLRDFLTGSS
jgi:pimeloyl-ACP methyl ester carboxylesterase